MGLSVGVVNGELAFGHGGYLAFGELEVNCQSGSKYRRSPETCTILNVKIFRPHAATIFHWANQRLCFFISWINNSFPALGKMEF